VEEILKPGIGSERIEATKVSQEVQSRPTPQGQKVGGYYLGAFPTISRTHGASGFRPLHQRFCRRDCVLIQYQSALIAHVNSKGRRRT
jgi:hypothetical protein